MGLFVEGERKGNGEKAWVNSCEIPLMRQDYCIIKTWNYYKGVALTCDKIMRTNINVYTLEFASSTEEVAQVRINCKLHTATCIFNPPPSIHTHKHFFFTFSLPVALGGSH